MESHPPKSGIPSDIEKPVFPAFGSGFQGKCEKFINADHFLARLLHSLYAKSARDLQRLVDGTNNNSGNESSGSLSHRERSLRFYYGLTATL